jgi:hypothetical protein
MPSLGEMKESKSGSVHDAVLEALKDILEK